MGVDREKRTIIREVNDRIRELTAGFGVTVGTCVVLCECGASDCLERVVAPIDAVDMLVLAPGHEREDEAA